MFEVHTVISVSIQIITNDFCPFIFMHFYNEVYSCAKQSNTLLCQLQSCWRRQTQASQLFYYHLIFYLHYPAFLPLCYFVWSCSEYFACFLVYAPDTRTKKESHLTWMEIWIHFSISPSSPFSPPLLSVPSLLNELQIKALRSLSSVQDTSTVVRKVLREHKNSSSEHWLCICWVYTWCVCFVYRNHRKQ